MRNNMAAPSAMSAGRRWMARTLVFASSILLCQTSLIQRVTIPSDAQPGFIVTSLPYWGQQFSLQENNGDDQVDVSKYFSVLTNGDVVTTSEVSSLLGEDIQLLVSSQLASESWQDSVHIAVKNVRDILVFPHPKYKGHIMESLPAGSMVEGLDDLAAVLGDGQQIQYTIHSGPAHLFELHQGVKNHVIIKTKAPLDHEAKSHYKLTIQAATEDTTVKPALTIVKIRVKDLNEHVPHFEKTAYYTIINEDMPSQSTVLRLKATDLDSGKVTYTMLPHDVFGIEPESGSVILKSKNRLTGQSYQLLVHAEDSGKKKSRQVSVNIDVEGKPPRPYQPHVVRIRHRRETRPVKEVEIPESMVGDLLDLTNDYMERFSFKDPEPELLDINPVTGTVRLKDGKRLDYEEQKIIDFTVVIRKTNDASYRDEQPVRIKLQDVNDEVPEFKNEPRPFLGTVSQNAAPGTSVYELMAFDADEESAVRYVLESGGEDRFEVDPETGVVRTKGNRPFRAGSEFEIGVSAQDIQASSLQKSPTHSLKIYVGERDPQFFETQYVASVPETASGRYEIIEVKAKSHQGFPITYQLTAESGIQSNEFAINQRSGVVDLLRRLDYEKDPQQYHLRVKAIENGRPTRTSTVNLIINLIDMNDNTPTFPLSQYIVQGIGETVNIGSDIIQVTATDLDSVTNSQLTYSVSDTNFTVQTLNNIGFIKTVRRLDYDSTPDHTYNFTVVATDNGTPARSGSAMVRVTVTNVNDEAPVFAQSIEHVQVSEDASTNTVVHVVQAYDPDGDDVTYSFKAGRLNDGPFKIDPKSGIITLVGVMDKSQVSYKLNVTATDNGRCCGGTTSKSNKGLVIVEVKDINNNAPRFPNCGQYNPTILEKENVGTSVIQVQAIDSDTGANGNVTYALVKSNDQSSDRFYIEPITGILRTADVFDREAQIGVTDYGVTVKAVDQGSPSLAGFCTFRVKIGDKNDNPPVFNLPRYETSIEEGSVVGKRVKQVYATDRDSKDNGKVEYFLKSDPSGFFAINQYSGWMTVARPMTGREEVTLLIEARDKGSPTKSSTAEMKISITQTVNSYPQWAEDYSAHPIRVTENAPINTIVKRLKAYSSIPDSAVNYIIQPGETPEQNGQPRSFHYRIDETSNEMLLLTYRPLDFEALPKFYLTIKAANRATNSLHNDTRVTIEVIDENDEIPQFIGLDENGRYPGSVAENLAPGAEVITVTATDKDSKPKYRRISYKIKEFGPDHDKFTIDRQTGLIRTKVEFDREKKNEYYLTVIAEDGANSDRPNHWPPGTPNQGEGEVQVRITDKNDNAPFFKDKVYTARVPENTDSGIVIISVTAEDKDEGECTIENRLTYSITGGNVGNAFEVVPDLGEIKVRGNIDYENGPREYTLTYRVFDDKFANTTTVVVQITDVNDNPPKFDNAIYNVTDVQEEEKDISRSNPRYLLTVRATDPDVNRHSNIRYGLTGQFADDGTFIINEHTGEVYLTKSLDRDHPLGRPVWNFNVLAHDEPDSNQPSLTGYAEVRVMPKDINDNSPVFDRNRLVGRVQEHSRAGMTVLTVIATDSDHGSNGTVSYSLKQVPMEPRGNTPLFSIDSHTGLISTTMPNALDREKQAEYRIIVQAKDRGAPPQSSSATVTIKVDDVNDHAPEFTQKIYRSTMSENYPKGASITSVSAQDKDIGKNARMTYTLKERDREYFSVTSVEATNTGVLKVFKPVDYDTLLEPRFNLTVYVRDPDTTHEDVAYIEVKVTDYNDNPPMFTPNSMKVAVYENVTEGTSLARFTASDRDTGLNKQFTYAIDRDTDKNRQFAIDGHGLVTTAKALDREKIPVHRVHILAIDKGTPPQTGVGTLIVTLNDVNDNFPTFAHDYRPVVYENTPKGQTVVEVSAIDKDTASNGPPFEFWLPCGGGCPCRSNPTCGYFGFKFVPGGGGNAYGAGIVTSLKTFDREDRKEYYMPIIMKDSGNPPRTGTNTLTIIIGDKNDNKHYPGHKNIFVYNYKAWWTAGEFEDAELGNVYAADEDDWDVANKTFSFVDREAEQQFRLDAETGTIYMRDRVREGEYNFQVKVYDVVFKRQVISSVSVIIKEINDDAVTSSGSMRLQGMTAEEFVSRRWSGPTTTDYEKSKYDELRTFIATKLRVPQVNVDIFTISNHPTLEKTIDIRYSAHGSPYYRPAKLDGILNSDKDQLEDMLGVRMLMSPIDECLDEVCESGGCSNRIITTNIPNLINTNGTSLIGITSYVKAECTCKARDFSQNATACVATSCLNGGTCHERDYDFYCDCPPGFDGPRCQQTRHSFRGNGWAWYKPLSQCLDSHTSLEFITQQDSGLILYNGPIRNLAPGEPQDYIAIELRGGYPILKINHGSGDGVLQVTGMNKLGERKMSKLSDGRWHRIDVYRDGKKIRMVVDKCKFASVTENEMAQTSLEDRSACEAKGETPGENRYINVNAPLQLGGRKNRNVDYPKSVIKDGFKGCIKNLLHNGELYDLHIGRVGEQMFADDGCPDEELICGANDVDGPKCGANGTCIGSFHDGEYVCRCKPGRRGPKCSVPTTTKDFMERSFIEWDFQDGFYGQLQKELRKTDIQLMFRTRQESGLLFKAQNAQKSEYLMLELTERKIRFRYNLGSGEQNVMLSHVNVSDGVWHTVYVERMGQWVVMKVDGGEGRFFNETQGDHEGHMEIRVSQRSLFAGGDVRFPSSNADPLVDYDYENSCMNDIRYNGAWFPMDEDQNQEVSAAVLTRSDNLRDGCPTLECAALKCQGPLTCYDMWRYAECRCPVGQKFTERGDSAEICEDLNECHSNPCIHGYCKNLPGTYVCNCYPGYTGKFCSAETRAVGVVLFSTGAILGIIISALALLLLILLIIVYTRRRRPEAYVVGVDPDDDVRENIIHYDEEGVGEEDQDSYDINRLKKPVDDRPTPKLNHTSPPEKVMPPEPKPAPVQRRAPPPGEQPDVGDFIKNRLRDADYDPNAPPHDSVREYAYEGGGSDAGSLSSLASTTESEDQNYDYLNNWGPRFQKLADMYGE